MIGAVITDVLFLLTQRHIANSLEEVPKCVSYVTLASSGPWASVSPSVESGGRPQAPLALTGPDKLASLGP